jgi:hypothetical protein
MRSKLASFTLLIGLWVALPAAAQLQYFGYVGGADDDLSLNLLKGFANYSHVVTPSDLSSTFVLTRVNAMAQKGQKASIDLGLVLWCDYGGDGSYRQLCVDWTQRWTTWKANNAAILTADKVLAFAILDEPFNRNAVMTNYEAAAQRVKADLPWAKVFLMEASCVIAGTCPTHWPSPGLGGYQGSLPGVDWLGLDGYGIHPGTDSAYQTARSIMKSRFPGRKWIYVLDGFWNPGLQGLSFSSIYEMGPVADEWYAVASADPDAVLLSVFLWSPTSDDIPTTSELFSCDILAHHVAIGRTVTHKVRPQTALPVGSFAVDANGVVSGWACDPDGTLCEPPGVNIYTDGSLFGPVMYSQDFVPVTQCSSGIAYRFTKTLNVGQSGRQVTAIASDLDSGSAALSNTCPGSVCVWTLQFYPPIGYLDNVDANGNAYGWVCDRDAPLISSQVRLVAGSTTVGVYTANLSNEPAVTTQCGGGTLHRFSVQLPAWARGLQVIAYAENLGSPTGVNEVKIPVTLCPNGVCIWH